MGGRHKQEFEPLLGIGFHKLTPSELRALCVESSGFSLSQRRGVIMSNLEMIFDRLGAAEINGDAWINGSFLTKKIEPCDADFLLHVDGELYDQGSLEQRLEIDWIISNLKSQYWCDTYPLFRYPPSHPLYVEYQWNHAFYLGRFGWSEEFDTKGIVIVSLLGGIK